MSRASRRGPSALLLGLELALGLGLLGGAALAGIAFVHRPWLNRLDVFAFNALPPNENSHLLHQIAALGSLPALLIGIGIAITASIWRDLPRAAACAIGPIVAVLITEQIAKPLVGRPAALGGYSYPSGTVTAVAALAAVVFLASPMLLRPLAALRRAGRNRDRLRGRGSRCAGAPRDRCPRRRAVCRDRRRIFTFDALFHIPALVTADREAREAAARRPEEGHFLERV